jgi:hypothetical protein
MDSSHTTKVTAIKIAVVWGVLGIGMNILSLYLLFFRGGVVPFSSGVRIPYHPMYQLANTVLVIIMVYGIYRRWLPCPVILIANTIGRAIYASIATGHFVIVQPVISIVIYSLAAVAMVAVRKKENIE